MSYLLDTYSSSMALIHFFNEAPDGMCILNAEAKFCQINLALERALGYCHADLSDRTLLTLVHPDDQAAVRKSLEDSLAQQRAVNVTSRCSTRSGHWHWLEWTIAASQTPAPDGRPIQGKLDLGEESTAADAERVSEPAIFYYCIARNVVERTPAECLHAERLQKDQAEQLRIIFEQAGVGIARLSPDGQWIQVNQHLCDMLGYDMSTLLQKNFLEISHLDDRPIDNEVYELLKSGQRSQVNFEKRYITQSGGVLWANVTASTVRDTTQDNGKLLYFIAIIQDITAQKEDRLLLQQQKDDLMMVNMMLTKTMAALEQRNQELDQFAYVTSHDLRAPLRAIVNLATWIEEDLGDRLPDENKAQFDLLKNRVHRMEGFINGLLAYSRADRLHQSHERVDVALLLHDIVDSLSPLGDFSVIIQAPMPIMEAKKVPLSQTFANLITNALKHHNRADGTIHLSARDLGTAYEFAIADDGPGIDPAYHEKIFTIFQTLQPRDELESTGIGLSLVKKIVTAEGGEVSVESTLGQGATFRFTWPKVPQQGLSLN
jgi:PAS domain S-box-containing protein